jgi:hypothetical protein
MPNRFVKIGIGVEGSDKAAGEFSKVKRAAQDLGQALKTGIGFAVGNQLLTQLSQIPQVLQQAVREGINFNAALEQANLGIAATLKQFDTTGRFENFTDALAAAGDAIDLLKEKAKVSPATFEQLVGAFQGLSGSLNAAGLQLKQQVDLVVLMSQALSGLGIRSDQILQESRALVTGNINEDAAAAKILGITKQQIEAARESGQLFEFLTSKLGAFKEAAEAGSKSLTTQLSNLEDSLTQLKGVATKEFFDQLKGGIVSLNEALAKESTERAAAGFGSMFAAIVTGGKEAVSTLQEFGKWAVEQPLLAPIGKLHQIDNAVFGSLFGGVKEAMSAGGDRKREEQLGGEWKGITDRLRTAKDEKSQKEAIAALDDTIAKRRAEYNAAAEKGETDTATRLKDHLATLGRIKDAQDVLLGSAKAQGGAGKDWYGDPSKIEAEGKVMDAKLARDKELSEAIRDAELEDMGPREKASRLRQRADSLRGSFVEDISSKGVELGSGFDPAKAAEAIAGMGGDPQAAESFANRLKEIISLEQELAATRKSAGDELAKNSEILTDLEEELAIERELVAGNEKEAQFLQIQRNLRKELATISGSDLLPAEKERATELAQQTAEMQKQKVLAEQMEKIAKARSQVEDLGTEPTFDPNVRGGKGARKRRQSREKFTKKLDKEIEEFRKAGGSEEEAEQLRQGKLQEYDKDTREKLGRFGGHAERSSRDNIGDLSKPSADFESLRKARPAALFDKPSELAPAAVQESKPQSSGEGGIEGAAKNIANAGTQVQSAASALNTSASTITNLANAIANLTAVLQSLDSAIGNLSSRVSALESSQGY